MTKSHSNNYFDIGVMMAQQPSRKFIAKDFLREGIGIRTIQRHLQLLERQGKVISDDGIPKGYKLAV